MATTSARSQPRQKKPTTYGKTSRTVNSWNLVTLDEDDQTTFRSANPRPSIVQRTQDRIKKVQAPEPSKAQEKKNKDAWDVPSSDDETELSPIKRLSPSRPMEKHKSVSLLRDTEEQLAPWEKTQGAASALHEDDRSRKIRKTDIKAAAQLSTELATALKGKDSVKSAKQPMEVKVVETKEPSPRTTSAAARLQAKKRLNKPSSLNGSSAPASPIPRIQKRPGQSEANPTPRKRQRSELEVEDRTDVDMNDAGSKPSYKIISGNKVDTSNDMDVYDIPESTDDESAAIKKPVVKFKASQRQARRGKITSYSSPRKIESAPARLHAMLPTDTDTTDTTSRSPSVSQSRHATPQKKTRPSQAGTSETAVRTRGTMTPKQAELWDQLLPDETATSPSGLPLKDLNLNSTRFTKSAFAPSRGLPKSASDLGQRRRTKLVDRLKASAPSTDIDMSDSESGSPAEDSSLASDTEGSGGEEPAVSQQSQSRSQSQSQTQTQTGPKNTYSSTRSYLPEDSFEDDLMFDLPCDFAPRHGKSTTTKSAFDFDDSDDEGASGRLRTIHELRAGGGNQRFMDDIGGLLEDISDHNMSARSRRRGALVDIATKLGDKTFAEKFFRQSYEQNLLTECEATPDDIADFALATAFAIIVSGEPPDHVAQSLKAAGLFGWLARMISIRGDAKLFAKERRNNMSKTAQAGFMTFVKTTANQEIIWGELKPSVITPRSVALKTCDHLVRELRRSGDSTELMTAGDIREILPSQAELDSIGGDEATFNVTLAISALESLSTAALSLTWPAVVMERLRLLLISPRLRAKASQHLLFLVLRLVLNLTNENPRNCQILSKAPTVTCILRIIAEGFNELYANVEETERKVNFDFLVLSIGILINLTEHDDRARKHAATDETGPILGSLVDVFQQGQQRLLEAESVEQSITNVAYGYLAVALANLCQERTAKRIIAARLPHQRLDALVDALEEFVMHHQRVDTENFDGEEGMEVWSAFTEKLEGILMRLKAEGM